MQNAPYDIGWIRASFDNPGAPVGVDDTTAMSVMLDEHHLAYNLDAIAGRCGVPGKDETILREAAQAWGMNPKSDMWRLPAKFVGDYAAQDALATLQCARFMRPLLDDDGVTDAYQLEMDLIPLIQEMRWRGIRIDMDQAQRAYDHCMKVRDETFVELSSKLGEAVGMEEIGRTPWLSRVFDSAGIVYPRTAPTSRFKEGQPSFTAGSSGWMHKHSHWLPQLIVKADKYNNAATKFIKGFILDYTHKGRLHASINQFMSDDEQTGGKKGAKTFRFSYSDPALQQMPSRDPDIGPLIRSCFVPEVGEKWCRVDYAQQEYRLIVHFAKLANLGKADIAAQKYIDDPNTDFHKFVADLTGLDRYNAKQVNFAKVYGAGIPKFAVMINKSEEESKKIVDQYDTEMPFIKEMAELCQRTAGKRGYIRLIDGARMHFPFWEGPWIDWKERENLTKRGFNLNPCRLHEAQERQQNADHPWHGKWLKRADTRKAMNGLIQGSAARQTKLAMRDCWREGIVPLLQVHDELNTSVASQADGERMARLMRDAVKLEIPVGADPEYGTNWTDAKHEWV
jgi:DNA polymerase I-like protein with 3'-5' exonuclease and polymerase domains